MARRVETFEALCHDDRASLARHGFRAIYFVPSHGGNFAPLTRIQPRLQEAAGSAVRVAIFTDLDAQIELWRRVVEEEAGLGTRVGGHADMAEGSIMLALHSEWLRTSEAVAGYLGPLTPEVLGTMCCDGIGAVTPNGILGDARGLEAKIAERCIMEAADMLIDHFRERSGLETTGNYTRW